MSHAKCKGAIFLEVNLKGSNLTDAVLDGASFIDVEINGATRLPNQETLQEVWNRHDKVEYTSQDVEQIFREEILRHFTKDKHVSMFSASVLISKIIQDDEHGREFEDYHFRIIHSNHQATSRFPKLGKSSLENISMDDEEF